MKVTKRIHAIWTEYYKILNDKSICEENKKRIKTFNPKTLVGKYQYIYSNKGRDISLIYLTNYFFDKKYLYEIMELNNKQKIERFRNKKEAIKRIKELLK